MIYVLIQYDLKILKGFIFKSNNRKTEEILEKNILVRLVVFDRVNLNKNRQIH